MNPLDYREDYLSDNKEGIRNLLVWFLNSVMLEETAQQSGCESYERTEKRIVHRNGYKPCTLKASNGELPLNKPQFGELPFESKVFENYSRVDQALKNAILNPIIIG